MGAYNITKSPYTCDNCFGEVVGLLDHFDRWLDPESLEKLFKFECACRERWRLDMEESERFKRPLEERILEGYAAIASDTNLSWAAWEPNIRCELRTHLSIQQGRDDKE